ncbi:hypothetical protein BASA50_009130 [Batrachochytrium salamandrivorans]|uniref:Uncharacterized protein n=1 Tax=Batrachochytrium salamandrivorans TaxID=1357716 RepID=A0ABQ8F3F0_9FUNG|nr:hypothetical protein BASA50_009130 [Batrachochytrium salamandrivorans]
METAYVRIVFFYSTQAIPKRLFKYGCRPSSLITSSSSFHRQFYSRQASPFKIKHLSISPMKPFILTFVAILATGTVTLALPTGNYADQSFLERRADDEDPPARPLRVESLLPAAPKPYKGKDQPRSGNYNSGSNADESTQKGLYSSAGSPRRGKKVAPEPKNTASSSEDADDNFPLRPISRKGPGRGKIKKIRSKKDPSPPNDGEPVYAKINRQKKPLL